MESEIDKLIILIKKRKPYALEKVMDLYMDSVYNVAKSILYNIASDEDIEECVQDIFLESWNTIEKFNPERGTFKTWILMLCKYKALNLRKSLNKHDKIIELDETLVSSNENLENNYLAKESTEEIISAINKFHSIDREIFVRRYILEQSIEDICTLMNLSRQAVDNRLWRGRKYLKELLNAIEGSSLYE